MAEHIFKQFDLDLTSIHNRVLKMGDLVEQQIMTALEALMASDLATLESVISKDAAVNAMEISIDEDCQHIIVRRQPAASDLRLVLTVIKIISDLERIGDEAQKIARMGKTIFLAQGHSIPRFREIRNMADTALAMLRRSLDAFSRLDASAAAQLAEQDRQLDDHFAADLRQLITAMTQDPHSISTSIDTLFMTKAIERIGDHAKNIAEYVVYLVEGRDIRHRSHLGSG